MTVYELIRQLSAFPPDVEVVMVPQKRQKWDRKSQQRVEYVWSRGFKPMSGDEPIVELGGLPG
jgi:hypothetical protein